MDLHQKRKKDLMLSAAWSDGWVVDAPSPTPGAESVE
jgi:hypothetical protein